MSTWIKLVDSCPDHPKIAGLSDAAFRAWVQGLCYCSRLLTDGRIPAAMLTRGIGTPKAARELVAAGLWVEVEGGWHVHEYVDHQRSREEVDAIRDEKSMAGSKGNHQRWHVDRGVCDPDCPWCKGSRSQPSSQVRSPGDSQTDRKRSPETEAETETDGEQDPPVVPPPQPALVAVAEVDPFDEFWHLYPRHEGKGQARKAWARALKRGSVDEILAGVVRYRDDPNRDPAFTAHPSTWLNGDRWTDDPLPARGTGSGRVDQSRSSIARFAAKARAFEQAQATRALPAGGGR